MVCFFAGRSESDSAVLRGVTEDQSARVVRRWAGVEPRKLAQAG